jgi:hypothetical protein
MPDSTVSRGGEKIGPSPGLRLAGIFGGAITGLVLSVILFFAFSGGNDSTFMGFLIVGTAIGGVLGFIFPRVFREIGRTLANLIGG